MSAALVDQLAIQCQQIINEIGPDALADVDDALGATVAKLIDVVKSVDLDTVENAQLRTQLEMVRAIDAEELESFLAPPVSADAADPEPSTESPPELVGSGIAR